MNMEIRYKIASFFQGDMNIQDFENIIYNNSRCFENLLGEEKYLDLIQLDFQDNTTYFVLEKLFIKYMDGTFFIDQVLYLINKFHLKKLSLTDILNKLDKINDSFELPINISGYSSEVNRLGEDFYREGALKELDKLLVSLDPNKIIYTDFFNQMKINTPNIP